VTPSPLEKAFGENRFVRALPFRQIKPTDKSKFGNAELRVCGFYCFLQKSVCRTLKFRKRFFCF